MYRSNIYPKMILLVSFFVLALNSVFAQTPAIEFKLQLMEADQWGVYARPVGVTPGNSLITGSGQVTVVMPLNFGWNSLSSVNGIWLNNANVHGPAENPTKTYASFGWQASDIQFQAGSETLLFTFKRTDPCPDSIYLIENTVDPFDILPNSVNSNPGNEITVFEPGALYWYKSNYSPSAWSCHDCDGDGILNAFEDTDGDGVYDFFVEDLNGNGILDPGEDADMDGYLDPDVSQICNPCDPIHPESATLELIGGADVICANDLGDTAWFKVIIEGGWSPFDVYYTFNGGTDTIEVLDYVSGDSIPFVPDSSVSLTILHVIDSFGCLLDTALGAPINLVVHGPISVTDQPDPVTECYGNSTSFCIATQNDGDGTIYQKWQVSTNGGVTWTDIQDGSVYDDTDSLCLDIANVANKHNYQYRAKIFTSVCDTVYSNAALLQVEGPITITTNPADFTNCATEDASFTAGSANGGLVGTMAYVWQYSTDGVTWTDLANGAGPGGANYSNTSSSTGALAGSSTVNLTGITVGMDGWYYRMKVSTGECSFVYSNAARLNVEGTLTVTDHPDDISNCAGSEVYFVADFDNAGDVYPADGTLTVTNYIWQISTDGGVTWANLTNVSGVYSGISGQSTGGAGSDSLAITNVLGLDGFMYRIVYTSPTCGVPVYSNPATLTVSGNVAFSDHPDDITVCSGSDTTFAATASIPQGTFTFAWEYSDDGGLTWDTIDFVADAALFQHSNAAAVGAGTDVLTITDVASMYNRRFRARADATDCNSVYSNEARLSVQGPLSVSDEPDDVVECSGNPTTFSSTIANPGVPGSTIVRWQISVDNGVTWNYLPTGPNPLYNGAGAVNASGVTTLSISNVAGLHNAMFRVSYRTSTCSIQFSTAARLTVEGPITVTDHPDDVTLCSGASTSFTSTADIGTAGTFAYQWQVSSDNGINWSDINAGTDGSVYTNFNTTILNVSDVTGLYGRCYRLAFSTGECNRVFSNRACLRVEGPITIDDQPDDIYQCSGEAVTFFIETTNSSPQDTTILYQWQESTDGGTTWTNLVSDSLFNGTETNILSLAYTTGKHGNRYRCIISTVTCSQIISNSALLQVEGPLSVTDEPDNITSCSGSGVTFSATIVNAGPGSLIYQWEESPDGGITWNPLTDGGVFSGTSTTTLSVSNVAGKYGFRYRLRYRTANCDSNWTNYAVLTVEGPISFTDQPDPVVECSGNSASFCVTTANTGQGAITYQWQVSVAGAGGPWFNVSNSSIYNGAQTACLSVSNVAGFNGFCYRVNIQTSTCSPIASDPACLTVEGPISFTDHPDDITQCSGESVTFSATSVIAVGNSGTMTYQWQWSSDNVNYSDIVAPGANLFSGWDTPTLTVGNVVGITGRRFRLAVSSGQCNNVFSFPATLTVDGPLTIDVHPSVFTNCSDKEAFFASNAINPGATPEFRQWQMSADGGTTWQDITQLTYVISGVTINFAGYDSDTLLVSPIEGLNGYLFRNNFWTATCNLTTTNAAALNVEGPISFTDQPDDVTLCSAEATCFTIAIANSTGVGTVQYQWQRWTATGWVDLANTAPYSGAFTNQLCISDVTGLYNNKFRCGVRTGNCEWDYSDLANLFVEGPITFNLQPVDASICSNRPHLFNTTVTNPGYGQMTFRWQYSTNGGTTWTNFPTNIGSLSTLGVVNPTDPAAQWQGATGQDLNLTNTDGLNGWMFRLTVTMPNCNDISNEVTLTVRDKCLAGDCDLDNDGTINDNDADDDNDQVTDYWEQWMTDNNTIVAVTEFPGTGPWNYTVSGAAFPISPYITYNRCLVDTDGDGLYDNQEDPDGDNINNGEETDGDITFDGNPLDPCSPILGPTCIGINLAIRVNLQGARIGVAPTDTLMRATLRAYGANNTVLIPNEEPYSAITNGANGSNTPFDHIGPDGGGTEELSLSQAPAVFGVTGEDAIVDWVFVELRSSTALDSVATTRAGFVQRDGDVVDLDGITYLRFPNASAGTYYVAVRHRNHLGVMTGEALDLSPALQEIDFTDPLTITNGTYGQLNLSGRMYMWAGDLNSDGRTIYQGPGNDVLKLFQTVLQDPGNSTFIANYIVEGYKESDVNLDGRSIYQGPLNDRSMLLLNTILSHPANVNLISNYVILETLP